MKVPECVVVIKFKNIDLWFSNPNMSVFYNVLKWKTKENRCVVSYYGCVALVGARRRSWYDDGLFAVLLTLTT